jgi:4-hydroxybenzoate polyprenyltransferase
MSLPAAIRLVRGRGVTWLVGVEKSTHRALAMVLLAAWALLALLPWVLGWHPLFVLLGALVGLLPMYSAIVHLRKAAQGEGRRREL